MKFVKIGNSWYNPQHILCIENSDDKGCVDVVSALVVGNYQYRSLETYIERNNLGEVIQRINEALI